MNHRQYRGGATIAYVLLGGFLILVGILFLVGQFIDFTFDVNIMSYAWPLFVLVPGIVLLISGLLMPGETGQGLTIAGSIVSTVGLLLFTMNITDLWASWAYAWALVAPTSFGVGLALHGLLHRERELVRSGSKLALIGLIIFAIGFVFFEMVIRLNGLRFFGLEGFCLPALLIGLGVGILFWNVVQGIRPNSPDL